MVFWGENLENSDREEDRGDVENDAVGDCWEEDAWVCEHSDRGPEVASC